MPVSLSERSMMRQFMSDRCAANNWPSSLAARLLLQTILGGDRLFRATTSRCLQFSALLIFAIDCRDVDISQS